MFERYTENARRTIFFARFEASQYGSSLIETEHLLLGLLREDRALANRLGDSLEGESAIRRQIDAHTPRRQSVSTSVDLPLSHECKRVLAYGSEEAERLNHRHIGTDHLLLGLLREDKCFATQLLHARGLTLHSVREQVRNGAARSEPALIHRLDQALADHQARGGIHVVKHERGLQRTTQFAVYASEQPRPNEQIEQIQQRLRAIVSEMEHAIANHDFEKARFYSDEELKERKKLQSLREQSPTEKTVPPLRIEFLGAERFSDIRKRSEEFIEEGSAEVWLLDPELKRAYTVTKADGLCEFKGTTLSAATLPFTLDLQSIFAS